MKKLLKSFLILTLLFSLSTTFALNEINLDAKRAYNSFIKKVERTYSLNKEVILLGSLGNKLDTILEKKTLSFNKKKIVTDLLKLNNEKLFNLQLKKEKIKSQKEFNKFPISSKFSKKILNKGNIFLENGVWYTYNYNLYTFFPKEVEIRKIDIQHNKVDIEKTIIFIIDDNNIGFITNYKKIKLISDDIIFGVPDKYNFLMEVKDDKRFLYLDTDELFKKLKNKTLDLTNNLKKEEKIKKIYDYLLKNVSYTNNPSLEDTRIFSGILTYNNKDGVCEGYAKLMMYMVNFANIGETKVIRGDVIDATDFPKIGHAWVSIGEKYYDPTFDDPIGAKKDKEFSEYKYYNLPKDLFYTNRYNYLDTPERLKTTSLDFRKNLISKNLSNLVEKYEKNDFILLKPLKFRKTIGLSYKSKITINDLKDYVYYFPVNSNFTYIDNGKQKQIKNFKYFTVDDDNIENTLYQLNYDLKGYYLYKWYAQGNSGNYDYRLSYDVKFR